MILIRLGFFLPCFIGGGARLVFNLSCFLQVNLESLGWLFHLFSLCSSFSLLFALFLSEELSFSATFLSFVSTFAGAYLADNLGIFSWAPPWHRALGASDLALEHRPCGLQWPRALWSWTAWPLRCLPHISY